MRDFFAELKRRNVYKVAVAYAVGSWLLIQVATQVFPFFEIPNWAVRLVVLLLILGFPVALILSWAFEITPEGIKRESEVAHEQSTSRHTGRKIVGLTIVVAVIAAVLLVFQLVRSKSAVTPRPVTQPEARPGFQSEAARVSAKSIAVLPFDNLTQNTAAYDAYLRGLAIEHTQYGYEAYQQAARDYIEAVQLDPNFAFAWARLAVLRSFLYFNAVDPNTNTAGAVKEAADRAMALAPEAGESWIAQGAYRYRVLRDFAGAVTAYKQAQIRLPNNSYLLQNLAFVQRRLGLWQEVEATLKKALELDPRDFQLLGSLGGECYTYLRRFDDARAAIDRALEISPDSVSTRSSKAGTFQSEGRLDEAAQELARIPADAMDDFVLAARIGQAIYERQFDK